MNAPWNVSQDATRGLPRQIAPDTWWFGWCLVVSEGDRYLHNGNNAFLFIGSKATALVDTVMPMGWPALKRDLARVLGGRTLDYIVPTHPEAPHMGNIEPLIAEYPNARIFGDMRNYHLFFPHLKKNCDHAKVGDTIDLGNRRLELTKAIIHDLPNTYWIYEPDIEFLCVGDGYPYTHDHEHGQCAMTSEELPAPIRPEDTSIVISRALNWAKYVDASGMMSELREFLREHPVSFVGPSHGGVITNVPAVTDVMDQGLASARGLP